MSEGIGSLAGVRPPRKAKQSRPNTPTSALSASLVHLDLEGILRRSEGGELFDGAQCLRHHPGASLGASPAACAFLRRESPNDFGHRGGTGWLGDRFPFDASLQPPRNGPKERHHFIWAHPHERQWNRLRFTDERENGRSFGGIRRTLPLDDR